MDVGLHLLAEVHVEATRFDGRVAIPPDVGGRGLFEHKLVLHVDEVRIGVGRGIDPGAKGEFGRAQAQIQTIVRGSGRIGVEPGEVKGKS